jgi:hypothetical protein
MGKNTDMAEVWYRLPASGTLLPAKGSRWRHHNNFEYVVLGWTNLRSLAAYNNEEEEARAKRYPPRVTYCLRDCESLVLEHYSRNLVDWSRSFKPIDG